MKVSIKLEDGELEAAMARKWTQDEIDAKEREAVEGVRSLWATFAKGLPREEDVRGG